MEQARSNLKEALELFFETADPSEIARRMGSHAVMQARGDSGTVTVPVPLHSELKIGTLQAIIRQSGLPRSLFEG